MSLRRLKKRLQKLSPRDNVSSQWTSYMTAEKSYSTAQFKDKCDLIDSLLSKLKSKIVLDLGCNKGHFSILAAQKGAQVIAVDSDPFVIGRLWRSARELNLPILPLVIDLGRPSPGMGWMNREHLSFLDRSRDRYDLVMMVALLHHLLVQERIPLSEVASFATQMTKKDLIIEYISPEDPMFQYICKGRDHLYKHLTEEFFENVFSQHFVIQEKSKIPDSHRTIYWMTKKNMTMHGI